MISLAYNAAVDQELQRAYQSALSTIQEEAERHNLLVEALMEFKTLYHNDIELIMTTRSLEKLRLQRKNS